MMKIFITGATGYIGTAVTQALVGAGHQVLGLARSKKSEQALKQMGASAVKGDLKDSASVKRAATGCDAAIHIAADYSAMVELDKGTVEALLAAKPRWALYTSGVLVLGDTGDKPADESASTAKSAPVVAWRPSHEKMVLDAGGAVIRPGFVWGGKTGNFGMWFAQAQTGSVAVVGDGSNRRAYVHREDLGRYYLLMLEKNAKGIFHAVDGTAPRVIDAARECAKLAGNGEVKNISVEEATKQMGPFASALTIDQVVATKRAEELGWTPKHPAFPKSIAAAYAEFCSA